MGCGGQKSAEADNPERRSKADPPGHSNYVHYLAESGSCWQLVVYSLEEGKFCTTRVGRASLFPECESTVINSAIYCSGGRLEGSRPPIRNEVKVLWFLRGNNTVYPFVPMAIPRYRHATASLKNSCLFAIGGVGGQNLPLTSCERCDIHSELWTPLPAFSSQKAGIAACGCGDKLIYIFGGTLSAFIEVLDISQGSPSWSVISCTIDQSIGKTTRLWCAQSSGSDIILLNSAKIMQFDTINNTLRPIADVTGEHVPDKRGEVKVHTDEVTLMLDAGGNLAIFSLTTHLWNIKPHIALF